MQLLSLFFYSVREARKCMKWRYDNDYFILDWMIPSPECRCLLRRTRMLTTPSPSPSSSSMNSLFRMFILHILLPDSLSNLHYSVQSSSRMLTFFYQCCRQSHWPQSTRHITFGVWNTYPKPFELNRSRWRKNLNIFSNFIPICSSTNHPWIIGSVKRISIYLCMEYSFLPQVAMTHNNM